MMTTDIDRIAKAIKMSIEQFESPVYLYIEPEARYRWQKQQPENSDEDWSDPDGMESYRIIARDIIEALGQ